MTERETRPNLEVKEVPDEIKLPEHLVKDGVEVVETAYKATVKDGGQMLTQTPQNQQVTITLPADPKTLKAKSKGPITNAATWLAAFWYRVFERAVHFGWKVVTKKQNA